MNVKMYKLIGCYELTSLISHQPAQGFRTRTPQLLTGGPLLDIRPAHEPTFTVPKTHGIYEVIT